MSNNGNSITHSPVNNFNAKQAEEFLSKAYEQSLREAQQLGASKGKNFYLNNAIKV